MSLASRVTALAARIAVEIKTVIRPRLLPNGGTAGQALVKSTADDYAVAWGTVSGGSGAATLKIEYFDANGTWTKPAGAKRVQVFVQGPGGGGSSGGRQVSGTVSRGGNPGGSGGFNWDEFDADDLDATVQIFVGIGGIGGASVTTDSTAGIAGTTAGSSSAFGSANAAYRVVAGGGGRGTATAVGAHGGGRYALTYVATVSSASGGHGIGNNTDVGCGVAPGAAGAGQTTTPGNYSGGSYSFTTRPSTAAFIGGASVGSDKTDAIAPTTPFALCYGLFGNGGPGGWSNVDGTAGAGANGFRGGGGGGGGASLNGNPSGKGGDGGKGRVVVVTVQG
ncbi:glycine-rich domain-containing protein [Methylobacterium sp. CM6247]